MNPKPRFTLAVTGLDPNQLRMIEIVFRHSVHNRYAYRLAVSEHGSALPLPPDGVTAAAIDSRGTDAADILLVGRSQQADADLPAWLTRSATIRSAVADTVSIWAVWPEIW